MNVISDMMGGLGAFGPLILAGGLGFLLILFTLPMLLGKSDDPLDKLKRANRDSAARAKGKGKGNTLRPMESKDKLQKFSTFLEPQDEEQYSAIRTKLIRAGYRTKSAVRIYYFTQLSLGIGLLLVGLSYVLLKHVNSDAKMGIKTVLIFVLLPAMIGYMAPKRWINKRAQARTDQIISGFPDSLDLMLVCVEAGQSLDQSILRVSKELQSSYPALAEEYQLVSFEIKAGKERGTVLRDFAERAGVPDVSSFVTVLIQSTTFGTPISEALRVYAAEMRDKRMMRAEEAANKLPTKMTLVTMGLTVPPLMLILVGPSVYDIYQTLNSGKELF